MSAISRTALKSVLAVETEEGVGAVVRRSIGSMSLRNLTPFLLLDHFRISKGAGFPDHPHRGQTTVTYMIEGSSKHEDSAGHSGVIEAGGVQWMTAGRGVIHAEMPVQGPGIPEPYGLQLWIDLPKEHKMVAPSYQELSASGVPTAYPEGPDGGVKIKVISGKSFDVESPVRPLGGCWYFHAIFSKKTSIFHELPPKWTTFVYILKGSLRIGGSAKVHYSFHTVVLSAEEKQNGVQLEAVEEGTEICLISGQPLDQEVVQYGPFVMTSRAEIQKTLLDYQMGVNGFEKAHVWKSEIGGLSGH